MKHIGKPFDMEQLVKLLLNVTGLKIPDNEAEVRDLKQDAVDLVSIAIPGLDLQAALARMSGMRSLYVRSAQDFFGCAGCGACRIDSAFSGWATPRNAACFCTLSKGNAATFGSHRTYARGGAAGAVMWAGGSAIKTGKSFAHSLGEVCQRARKPLGAGNCRVARYRAGPSRASSGFNGHARAVSQCGGAGTHAGGLAEAGLTAHCR